MRIKCGDDVYREWLAAIYIFIYIYMCLSNRLAFGFPELLKFLFKKTESWVSGMLVMVLTR